MSIALIVDLVLAAFILLFIISGAARGLARTILGFLKDIVALVGASVLSKMFEPTVTSMLLPIFRKKMIAKVLALVPDKITSTQIPSAGLDFSGTGLTGTALTEYFQQLKQSASQSLLSAGGQVYAEISQQIENSAENILATSVRAALFVACFVLLLFFLTLLINATDWITRLPIINTFNKAGGALLGLLRAMFIIYLMVYGLKLIGLDWFTDLYERTVLLNLFATYSPLELTYFLRDNAKTVVTEIKK